MTDGLYGFRRCPTPGCCVMVYGIRGLELNCRAHGGTEPIEVDGDDEWGDPTTPSAAAGGPSPAGVPHSPEV